MALFGAARQQPDWMDFLRRLQAGQMGAGEAMPTAPVGPVNGQPLPPAALAAPKGGGLFGGSRPSPAQAAKIADMNSQPNQRQTAQQPGGPPRYGMLHRLYDAAATYEGAPTFRDAMAQGEAAQRQRAEAAQFGADFGKAGMNMNGDNADQTYALMARQIAERQARGEDVSSLITLADNLRGNALASAMANSAAIPENLRSTARAAPSAGAAFAYDQQGQDLYGSPGSPGGVWRGSKAGPDFKQVIGAQPGWDWTVDAQGNAAPRPGGPADPAYDYESAYNRTAGQVAATPPDPVDPLSEGQVVAGVLQKALTAGSPDALNPAERAIFDKAVAQTGGNMDMLTALLLGGGAQGVPQSRPGAGGSPYGQPQQRGGGGGSTGAGTQANPARPQTQADYDRLPRGAYFIDEDGLKVKE